MNAEAPVAIPDENLVLGLAYAPDESITFKERGPTLDDRSTYIVYSIPFGDFSYGITRKITQDVKNEPFYVEEVPSETHDYYIDVSTKDGVFVETKRIYKNMSNLAENLYWLTR